MASFNTLPRRRRGQSLLFTPVVSDSGEQTETNETVQARSRAREGSTSTSAASGSSRFYRSSSSPLIYQTPQHPVIQLAAQQQLSHSHLHLGSGRRSSSNQQLYTFPLPLTRPVPLVEPLVTSATPYSGSDAEDEDEIGPILLRRSSSQRLAASLGSGMTHRRGFNEPEDDARTVSNPSRIQPPLNGHGTNSKVKESQVEMERHPIMIGINGSAIHWSVNMAQITPLLFQCLRTLAVIPAGVETITLLARVLNPKAPNTSLDYIAAAAWSILTAYQALKFTTGLLNRWRHYYPLTATLIRLVGLQAICWPATFYTLRLLQYDGVERPLVCWSVIGTTTCITRSIQMWVTSNIEDWYRDQDARNSAHTVASIALGFGEKKVVGGNETEQEEVTRLRNRNDLAARQVKAAANGKVRKWDWNEVVWKCAFPAGVCYFFMAWAMLLSKELYPCRAPEPGL